MRYLILLTLLTLTLTASADFTSIYGDGTNSYYIPYATLSTPPTLLSSPNLDYGPVIGMLTTGPSGKTNKLYLSASNGDKENPAVNVLGVDLHAQTMLWEYSSDTPPGGKDMFLVDNGNILVFPSHNPNTGTHGLVSIATRNGQLIPVATPLVSDSNYGAAVDDDDDDDNVVDVVVADGDDDKGIVFPKYTQASCVGLQSSAQAAMVCSSYVGVQTPHPPTIQIYEFDNPPHENTPVVYPGTPIILKDTNMTVTDVSPPVVLEDIRTNDAQVWIVMSGMDELNHGDTVGYLVSLALSGRTGQQVATVSFHTRIPVKDNIGTPSLVTYHQGKEVSPAFLAVSVDASVKALNSSSGATLWSIPIPEPCIAIPPAYDPIAQRIFISHSGGLIVVDYAGNTVWAKNYTSSCSPIALAGDGIVLLPTPASANNGQGDTITTLGAYKVSNGDPVYDLADAGVFTGLTPPVLAPPYAIFSESARPAFSLWCQGGSHCTTPPTPTPSPPPPPGGGKPSASPSPPPKKKSHAGAIVGIIFAVLLVFGIAGAVLFWRLRALKAARGGYNTIQ